MGEAFEEPAQKGKIVPDDRGVADMALGTIHPRLAARAEKVEGSEDVG
jgi:hypothetical protein